MSRFTLMGWIMIPFIVLIRIPFALPWMLFGKLSELCTWLSDTFYAVLCRLPVVQYRKEWIQAMDERIRKERLDSIRMGSQQESSKC